VYTWSLWFLLQIADEGEIGKILLLCRILSPVFATGAEGAEINAL